MTASISSQFIMSSLQRSVTKLQSELADRSLELSTGRRSDLGVQLGSRTGSFVSFRIESTRLQSVVDTNNIVSGWLGMTQSKLESIQSSAESMLNSLLASGFSAADASTMASAGKNRLSSLMSELNTTSGGDFLFAGTNTSVAPIAHYTTPSSEPKQAVDTAFAATFGFAQSSPSVSGIDGAAMQSFLDSQFAALFQDPSWGNTWSSASDAVPNNRISPRMTRETSISANETVFRQLAQAYTMLFDLGNETLGADAYESVTHTAADLLRSAIGGLTDLRGEVGAIQSDVEDANAQMSIQMGFLMTQDANLGNVDAYEVTSRLNELQTQLEASYRLAAQMRELSLVHYI